MKHGKWRKTTLKMFLKMIESDRLIDTAVLIADIVPYSARRKSQKYIKKHKTDYHNIVWVEIPDCMGNILTLPTTNGVLNSL